MIIAVIDTRSHEMSEVDKQLTELEKAGALIATATVTVGVAGDKLANLQMPGSGPILEAITETLHDLGAIADWLVCHCQRQAAAESSELAHEIVNLKLELAAARRQADIPDMVIDGYVNYVIASKAIRIEAMPFHAWLAGGDREEQP
jgi:hypothetical protein